VKTTQLPWEGAIESRGPAQVAAWPHTERDSRPGTPMTSRNEQLTSDQLRGARPRGQVVRKQLRGDQLRRHGQLKQPGPGNIELVLVNLDGRA
jgi:hypothetical protein